MNLSFKSKIDPDRNTFLYVAGLALAAWAGWLIGDSNTWLEFTKALLLAAIALFLVVTA